MIKNKSCKITGAYFSSLHWVCISMFVVLSIFPTGCKKLVEIPPPQSTITDQNAFSNDESAIAVLTGIYTTMSGAVGSFAGSNGISVFTGLSADELTEYSGFFAEKYVRYYQNDLINNPNGVSGSELWEPLYNYVYKCNAAIEGVTASGFLTPAVKRQLIGEAKFLRGVFYFYLFNLFDDVPLAVSTDYEINTLLKRSSKTEVYRLVINDLTEAEELLSDNYLNKTFTATTLERVRPTKWAAAAMLARAYLFNGDHTNAELQSSMVINNSGLYNLCSIDSVFLKNNTEAIWQIQPTDAGFNTWEAFNFVLLPDGPLADEIKSVHLSVQQLTAFENGDQRRMPGKWIDSIIVDGITYHFPFKYKKHDYDPAIVSTNEMSEYLMMFRLAEQYLIRAEARAYLGNIEGAQNDLDMIRSRAGLANTTANDQPSLLAAIFHERQVELFTEMGHRWFDLKRTGNVDAIMNVVTPLKGGTWQTTDQLYPLPYSELQKAPNLQQNDGY